MDDLRRITVEDVRAALAALPGFTLTPGVTFDLHGKRCCPEGAIAAARGLKSTWPDEMIYLNEVIAWLVAEMGMEGAYASGFARGFDNAERSGWEGEVAYDLGYWDGRAVRKAFGIGAPAEAIA